MNGTVSKSKIALLWFFTAAVIAIGLGSLNVPIYYTLLTRGVTTQALILQSHPEIHCTAAIRYQVNGKEYINPRAGAPVSNACSLPVGSRHVIYYDPKNPEHFIIGNPQDALENELISIFLPSIFIPSLILYYYLTGDKQKKP